eukprot:COSAG03_NODE_10677_length_636_cov_0.912477_1_plen_71_part_10
MIIAEQTAVVSCAAMHLGHRRTGRIQCHDCNMGSHTRFKSAWQLCDTVSAFLAMDVYTAYAPYSDSTEVIS